MAVVVSLYNSTVKRLLAGDVDLTNCKVMLLNNSAVFTATDVTLAGPAGAANVNQVSGNGWDAGGELLTITGSIVTTNDGILDAVDISVTATGGAIGPAYKFVIYDDTEASDAPLVFCDFGGSQTAGDGTDFKIIFASDGIIKGSYTLP